MKRFFVSLLLSAGLLNAADSKPPNIIVILADDLGFGDLGCYGSDFKTPAIDKLAAEGVRCTNLILPANVCSPSRAAIRTGRYPMDLSREDIRFVIGRLSDYSLDSGKDREWQQMRELHVDFADSSPLGGWVDTDDLNNKTNKKGNSINDVHYTQDGYKI